MYYRKQQPVPSINPDTTPDRGPTTDPNPGELSAADIERGAPLASLGLIPARGNRAGGGQQIDLGAMVGIMRNLEFTAGGRAHRLSTGTFSHAAPVYDPKTRELHISTASESGEPTIGPAFGNEGQPAMPPQVEGAGDVNDTTRGDTGPGRRRDTKTP
jgi:hypothetical protein